jgi:hypothetical protein
MVATVVIEEMNGAGETTTSNITNMNFGNVDAPNLTVSNFPITVNQCSFVKYWKIKVTALGGSNKIDNMQGWKSAGAYLAEEQIVGNFTTSAYASTSYATPATTSISTYAVIPTADPGTANIGIAGSLAGSLSGVGSSDIIRMQLQTGPTTPPGSANQKTFTFQYDEQ